MYELSSSFTFSLCVSFKLKGFCCRQHTFRSCFPPVQLFCILWMIAWTLWISALVFRARSACLVVFWLFICYPLLVVYLCSVVFVLQCEALIPACFLFEHLLQFSVVWSPRAYRRHIVIIDYFKLTTTLITNKCLGYYPIPQMYIFVFTINLLFLYSFNLL